MNGSVLRKEKEKKKERKGKGKKALPDQTRAVEDSKLYLDFVGVHASVGDKDVCVLDPFGLINPNLLVKQESC